MKRFLTVGLIAAGVMSLAACGSKTGNSEQPGGESGGQQSTENTSDQPIELVYFHGKNEIVTGLEKMAEEFNRQFPEYKVVMEMQGTDYDSVLQGKFAANNPPAMMSSYEYSDLALAVYLKNNMLVPVEDLELFQHVNEAHKEGLRLSDGHIYAVPVLSAGKGLMYNSELFEQAGITEIPKTADELWAACDKLVAAGITPFAGGHQDEWTISSNLWRTFYDQHADKDFPERMNRGEASFEEIVPEFTAWLDQYKKYSMEPIVQTNWATALGALATGQAAMVINGPWTILSINEMDPEVGAKFRMIGNLTTNEKEKNLLIEDVDQHMLIIKNSDEVVEGSKKFLNWMLTDETAKQIFASDIKCPNPSGIKYEGTPVDNDIAMLCESGESKFGYVGLNGPQGWSMETGINIQKYLMGEVDTEGLVRLMDESWAKMYADSMNR